MIPFGGKVTKKLKMTKRGKHSRPARENLYTIVIVSQDDAGAESFAKWRGILVDRPATWRKTCADIKRLFPLVHHVNQYGGISGKFIKQIPVKDL